MNDAPSPTEDQEGAGRLRRMVGDAREQVREARVRGLGVSARIPEKIGRYRILGVEGHGGMGVVYRAEQSQPRRIVALKVIRSHHLSANSLRRFFYEAESLGRLQHPGIARIYEADVARTALGSQPFLALEFIDKGLSLTQYAKQHNLDLRARLQLLVSVCEAVHHAHQKGVIHRDLKPANILVDEAGQPKILDFGIARILEDSEHGGPTRTLAGQLVGTIPYMSPEQCSADPDEVDIRTDIYSLGVIAYELLADRLPHDIQKTPMLEAARIIREQTPTPLGVINRIYRGDLETVVAKALRRDKADRYQSALELAADIMHFLRNEPISARTASVPYQIVKFIGRNRALAGAFLTCMLALIGTTAAVSWALTAEHGERRSEEVAQAQQFVNENLGFLARSLYQSNPAQVLEILSQTKAQADKRFRDAPRERAIILDTLAMIHWGHLQTYDRALEYLSDSLAILRKEFGEHNQRTLRVANIFGDVLRDAEELEQAEVLAREWYEICLNHFGAEHEQTTRFATNLADAFKGGGKLADAERLYRTTLKLQRQALLPEHPDLPETMTSLAEVLVRQGQAREAIQFAEEAYESASKFDGPDSIVKYLALMIRGWAHLELREYADAERDLKKATDNLGQILGRSHPYTLEAQEHLERLPEIP